MLHKWNEYRKKSTQYLKYPEFMMNKHRDIDYLILNKNLLQNTKKFCNKICF